jgi:hypothetical protein
MKIYGPLTYIAMQPRNNIIHSDCCKNSRSNFIFIVDSQCFWVDGFYWFCQLLFFVSEYLQFFSQRFISAVFASFRKLLYFAPGNKYRISNNIGAGIAQSV